MDEEGHPIHDELILNWKGGTWLSFQNGKAPLPAQKVDNLSIHSMGYRDTTVVAINGDTLVLFSDNTLLKEVSVGPSEMHSNVGYVDFRRSQYDFQREPGDYYLLGFKATESVWIDSITVHVNEVLRPSTRLRVIIWQNGKFLFESELFTIGLETKNQKIQLPCHYLQKVKGELFIGIQFLETDRNPFTAKSHLYQYRGKGNLYTKANTGITLGGMRLKEGEILRKATFFNSQLKWEVLSSENNRRRAPYLGVWFSGGEKLETTFE
ncbi:MAG: hypothetical protein SchgKO_07740 [Schleiferiaceae bacterium]